MYIPQNTPDDRRRLAEIRPHVSQEAPRFVRWKVQERIRRKIRVESRNVRETRRGEKWNWREIEDIFGHTRSYASTSSSLRIKDRSFQYASPRLWNQLPASLVNHALISPILTHPFFSGIGSVDSPLSSSITRSLFHSRLKTSPFCKSFPP